MAEEQHKRPSLSPSDESFSIKKSKAPPASPTSPMSSVIVKQEPGEGQVAQGGIRARAAAAERTDPAMARPRINLSFEVQLFHCEAAGCYRHLKPPVFKCEAGHLLCENCRFDGQCRNCNGAATFIRCHVLERYIDGARAPCPYEASGCGSSVVYHEIFAHRDACPCLVPGCRFTASPPMLRDHLAGGHSWAVDRIPGYARAHPLCVPAAESHRLLVVDGDEPRLFVLSVRWRGAAAAVSVACVRASAAAAAGPHYKCFLWAHAPTPPDAPWRMERRMIMETDVASCAAPGGPGLDDGMWLDVMPEMLHGPSREMHLRVRVEEIRSTSASALSANPSRSVQV